MEGAGHTRSFLPFLKVKDYIMIDDRDLFDQPVKKNVRIYENIEMARRKVDDYTTGCLLLLNYSNKIIS